MTNIVSKVQEIIHFLKGGWEHNDSFLVLSTLLGSLSLFSSQASIQYALQKQWYDGFNLKHENIFKVHTPKNYFQTKSH